MEKLTLEELKQKAADLHDKIMFAKLDALTFLNNNKEALGYEETTFRFGEEVHFLRQICREEKEEDYLTFL